MLDLASLGDLHHIFRSRTDYIDLFTLGVDQYNDVVFILCSTFPRVNEDQVLLSSLHLAHAFGCRRDLISLFSDVHTAS